MLVLYPAKVWRTQTMKEKCAFIITTFFVILFLIGCNKVGVTERRLGNDLYFEGENIKGLKESEIIPKIKNLAIKINENSKDAKLNEDNWELSEEERKGIKVNEEKTLEMIFKAKDGEKVEHITEEVQPKLTAKYLNDNIVEIGQFTTIILDQKLARVNNIEIATEWLNNVKVLPGKVFSFNEILGKRTRDKGYEKAPIIVNTKKGPQKGSGVGGGICQISSTLYNAAKIAGLEIVERHSHSKKVAYVPLGQDATVSYGSTDFKFRNNKVNPIMIKILIIEDRLTVSILEKHL